MTKNPKRPRDPNQLAKAILDITTGEEENTIPKPKDPAAVALGRKGGMRAWKSLVQKSVKALQKRVVKHVGVKG